jgi:hypothetical protein
MQMLYLLERMIHALRTFRLRLASLADANETLATQRDHALISMNSDTYET